MKARTIGDGIFRVGAVDWDRRLFDELIPLPDGTSYNAYLIRGEEKTALIDAVDPTMADVLLSRLNSAGAERIDYIVSHHAEQDHPGAIPHVLARHPEAKVVATEKCKGMLAAMVPNLKVEVLTPVLCKDMPKTADLEALDRLAEAVALKHQNL